MWAKGESSIGGKSRPKSESKDHRRQAEKEENRAMRLKDAEIYIMSALRVSPTYLKASSDKRKKTIEKLIKARANLENDTDSPKALKMLIIVHFLLARAHFHGGSKDDLKKMESSYKAITEDCNDGRGYQNLSFYYMSTGNYDEAKRFLTEAIEGYEAGKITANQFIYVHLGRVYHREGSEAAVLSKRTLAKTGLASTELQALAKATLANAALNFWKAKEWEETKIKSASVEELKNLKKNKFGAGLYTCGNLMFTEPELFFDKTLFPLDTSGFLNSNFASIIEKSGYEYLENLVAEIEESIYKIHIRCKGLDLVQLAASHGYSDALKELELLKANPIYQRVQSLFTSRANDEAVIASGNTVKDLKGLVDDFRNGAVQVLVDKNKIGDYLQAVSDFRDAVRKPRSVKVLQEQIKLIDAIILLLIPPGSDSGIIVPFENPDDEMAGPDFKPEPEHDPRPDFEEHTPPASRRDASIKKLPSYQRLEEFIHTEKNFCQCLLMMTHLVNRIHEKDALYGDYLRRELGPWLVIDTSLFNQLIQFGKEGIDHDNFEEGLNLLLKIIQSGQFIQRMLALIACVEKLEKIKDPNDIFRHLEANFEIHQEDAQTLWVYMQQLHSLAVNGQGMAQGFRQLSNYSMLWREALKTFKVDYASNQSIMDKAKILEGYLDSYEANLKDTGELPKITVQELSGHLKQRTVTVYNQLEEFRNSLHLPKPKPPRPGSQISKRLSQISMMWTSSSSLSGRMQRDDHWYTDDEINILFKTEISRYPRNGLLTAMLGTNWKAGNTLLDNLIDFMKERAVTVNNQKLVENDVFIPVNLGTEGGGGIHWVLLILRFDRANISKIFYIDPLGNGVDPTVESVLWDTRLFPGVSIHSSFIHLQQDGVNCGPWIVAAATFLLRQPFFQEGEEMNQILAYLKDQDMNALRAAYNGVINAHRTAIAAVGGHRDSRVVSNINRESQILTSEGSLSPTG